MLLVFPPLLLLFPSLWSVEAIHLSVHLSTHLPSQSTLPLNQVFILSPLGQRAGEPGGRAEAQRILLQGATEAHREEGKVWPRDRSGQHSLSKAAVSTLYPFTPLPATI